MTTKDLQAMTDTINVVLIGILPEYSVVRYHVKGKLPRVGYVLHGSGDNVVLVLCGSDCRDGHFLNLGEHELVELLATPARTACFYVGQEEKE
jgi:hypothetical protein